MHLYPRRSQAMDRKEQTHLTWRTRNYLCRTWGIEACHAFTPGRMRWSWAPIDIWNRTFLAVSGETTHCTSILTHYFLSCNCAFNKSESLLLSTGQNNNSNSIAINNNRILLLLIITFIVQYTQHFMSIIWRNSYKTPETSACCFSLLSKFICNNMAWSCFTVCVFFKDWFILFIFF